MNFTQLWQPGGANDEIHAFSETASGRACTGLRRRLSSSLAGASAAAVRRVVLRRGHHREMRLKFAEQPIRSCTCGHNKQTH